MIFRVLSPSYANKTQRAYEARKGDKTLMKNLKMSVKKNTLVITMDIAPFVNRTLVEDDLSTSGKSYVVAGTNGFQKLEGTVLEGLNLSLNLNASRKAYDAVTAMQEQKVEAKAIQAEIAAGKAPDLLGTFASLTPEQQHAMLFDMLNLASKK